MARIVSRLKPSIAASIGKTIARHSYLDAIKTNILSNLLGISVKQCRVAIRLPESRRYSTIIEDLLKFHGIHSNLNFRSFATQLLAADLARNTLAHSLYLEEDGQTLIQLVRGNWDLPQDFVSMNRALNPETVVVERKFLSKKRLAVETAIKRATKFDRLIVRWLQALNERRMTQPQLDRRTDRQSAADTRVLRLSSQG